MKGYITFLKSIYHFSGFKFALLQLKLAVIAILLNFKVANGSARDFQRIKNEEKAPFVVLPKRTSKLIFHAI